MAAPDTGVGSTGSDALTTWRQSFSSQGDDDKSYELDDFGDNQPYSRLLPNNGTRSRSHVAVRDRPRARTRRSAVYYFARLLQALPVVLGLLIATAGIFFPSYSNPPERYQNLRFQAEQEHGYVNTNNEQIFIAATLHDPQGELVSGAWGRSVLRLIDILGPENVFLSIYEDNPDDAAKIALKDFQAQVGCGAEVVSEELDLQSLPHVVLPTGQRILKRIVFLSEVRNRALRPLYNASSLVSARAFDKLLYLNDVAFDPVDAANLLFSTNVDESSGRTRYRAACAMDFINPFKYYDTFATRDLEGYDMGIPFYPFFSGAGAAQSRADVLMQKDAVRLRSCWGGMIAFEAKWFQAHAVDLEHSRGENAQELILPQSSQESSGDSRTEPAILSANDSGGLTKAAENGPVRFRAEESMFWEASECCLIHADISNLEPELLADSETGIFMNPYIRVAYSESVLQWLPLAQRFERLYTPIQGLMNWLAARPSYNPRQFEQPGDEVVRHEWTWNGDTNQALGGDPGSNDHSSGQYTDVKTVAGPGGFCGARRLFYIRERTHQGERNWAEMSLAHFS